MNALVRKLGAYTRLSRDDEALVMRVATSHLRSLSARVDVATEGEKPEGAQVFLEGWGCRYRSLEDGRRQIMALFLPGDVCDLDILFTEKMDHSIATITPASVGEIRRCEHDELMAASARLQHAFAWERLVSAAIQREWTVNLGQRSAFERMAHLLCEIFLRLRSVGLTRGTECEFPLTQIELGEVTGLSAVHVNRTLQQLRAEELIVLRERTLSIPDLDALMEAALFDPGYLHLGHEGRHLDANA
jgi:CRP-like cAMP-binding protein